MGQTERAYLTARQAAELSGVSLTTLYAYVSRGQLRSEAVPGRTRERRYHREDIERLLERKAARRDPDRAAARGLHWGSPVLPSGITLIQDGKLYYRGEDALALARHATLEEVAELLWEVEDGERLFAQRYLADARLAKIRAWSADPLTGVQAALPLVGAEDAASYDLRPAAVRLAGARILRLVTAMVTGGGGHGPAHVALQQAWAPGSAAAGEAIRQALVLCADHELNVSAFTARCAASSGATLYDTIGAGMAALKGRRHGGETQRVSRLFVEAGVPARARVAVAKRLREEGRLAGFGHRLYPAGDPRAALLLRLARVGRYQAQWRLAQALARAGRALSHDLPNLDFGLVAMSRSYGLPEYAPLVLFAVGRTVGWIAHAIEQYASGELIRPRAQYTGRRAR